MNPAAFAFPLNVYAALLQWAEGRADYLHYGLFESEDEAIAGAQERASQRLWAQLPPPCGVLEVGIGLGTTLARLRAQGYRAHGITPDAAQVEAARERGGAALSIGITRLEDLQPASQPWDVMLLQESAQYIEPLALFEAAERLLSPRQATLVVMDEFALERRSEADSGLHLLPHFKALAERFGWRLDHEEDVSRSAQLTLDVLLRLTRTFRARLQAELGVPAVDIDALDQSNRRYRELYRCGVYGYRLLRFTREAPPPLQPVAVVPGHVQAMRATFHRVFGRELGQAEWAWKYGQGRGRGVGLLRDGELLAFYGGLSRPLSLFGKPALGCQVCDVMVAPGVHAALARKGALQRVTATFLEAEIGWGRRHAVGFGFPTARALGVAERLGLYGRVDEMIQMEWRSAPTLARWRSRLEAIEPAALHEGSALWRQLDRLWQAMVGHFAQSAIGVRDAAWLRHRYLDKPDGEYQLLLLRSRPLGRAIGALAVRLHAGQVEVLDLVGAPRHFGRLIDAVRAWAHACGKPLVRLWITASHVSLLGAARERARTQPIHLFIPANAHSPGMDPATLAGRWFLTGGDTDFR